MKRKNKDNSSLILFGAFFIFGMIFVVIAIALFINHMNFQKKAVEVTAEILDIETSTYIDDDGDRETKHSVYVSFEYNGAQYDNVYLPVYTAGMSVGKEINILCNPDDPSDIDLAGAASYIGEIIALVIGLAFALIGGIGIFVDIKNRQKKKKLLNTGMRIMAVVSSIERNTSVSVNGRNPYVIYCTYTDEMTGIVYRYKSDNLWDDPSFVVAPGMYIPVYVEGNDYSRYTVDAESVLNNRIVDYT